MFFARNFLLNDKAQREQNTKYLLWSLETQEFWTHGMNIYRWFGPPESGRIVFLILKQQHLCDTKKKKIFFWDSKNGILLDSSWGLIFAKYPAMQFTATVLRSITSKSHLSFSMPYVLIPDWNGLHHGMIPCDFFTNFMVFLAKEM